jgi:hypothetical protein
MTTIGIIILIEEELFGPSKIIIIMINQNGSVLFVPQEEEVEVVMAGSSTLDLLYGVCPKVVFYPP